MPDLVFIIGPPAVGKMTVGQALADRTGMKLMHNHVSIEVALGYFDFGTPGFNAISGSVRRAICEAVAASDLPGLVFTFVWAFDLADDQVLVEQVIDRWRAASPGAQVYFLELMASDAARRERNQHPDRLAMKPSKRDVSRSETLRQLHDRKHRLNSGGALPVDFPHMIVDNTNLPPATVAERFLSQYPDLRVD